MKYFKIVLVLGFLLMSAASFAADHPVLIVSGSNDPDVNGTYTYDVFFNGKASWIKGDYALRWSDAVMGDSWNIEKPSAGAVYYTNWSLGDIPEETNWYCQADAVSPCIEPVVTADPLPNTLFVSGTVDTFLNGEYARNLNQNGYPRYVMGDFDIHAEPVWLMYPWTIGKIGTAEQYYTTPSYGVYVPEGGWNAAAYASDPPVPPVVTAEPLPEKLFVSGTVDEFLIGEYVRGLNMNGCPYYTKGDYVISRESWTAMTMGPPWSIGDTSSGNIYYDNYDEYGVNVPEKGWFLGFSAGSPPSPPVVSATSLPDKYKVSGAGSSEVNGIYSRSLNSADGLLVYEKDSLYFLEGGYFGTMALGYGITKSGSGTYYSVLDDSLLIPRDGWSLNIYGAPNPPFVTPYRFPWSMYLPSFTGGKE